MTKLDSQSLDLESSVNNLQSALSLEPTDIVKDACIKRFELVIELSWKAMQTKIADLGQVPPANPKDCVRQAAQYEILSDPELWLKFLKIRNYTAHIYSAAMASSFYEQIKAFLPLVQDLLTNLKSQA